MFENWKARRQQGQLRARLRTLAEEHNADRESCEVKAAYSPADQANQAIWRELCQLREQCAILERVLVNAGIISRQEAGWKVRDVDGGEKFVEDRPNLALRA